MSKPNKTPAIGHNNPPAPSFADTLKTLAVDLPALKANALNAGQLTAGGHDSILSLGLRVYASAKYAGLASGDVAAVYVEYCKGQNASKYGAQIDVNAAKSMKVGRSKLLCFHKLANIPGTAEYVSIIPRTIAILNGKAIADGKAKGGSLYEKVLKVVRKVVKDGERPLPTDEELASLLFPPKVDKSIVDKLEAIDATCQTIIDNKENVAFSWYFANVQSTVREQIKAINAAFEEVRVRALRESEEGEHNEEELPEDETQEEEVPNDNDPLARFLEAAE